MTWKRPFIFINSAMSADGKISSYQRSQVRISGQEDLARVDSLRAGSDAVMVGVGTVLADDPRLRVKSEELRRERVKVGRREDPLRVVVDSKARTPLQAQVLGVDCLLAVSEAALAKRIDELSRRCQVMCVGRDRVDLLRLMGALWDRGIRRLMVEGGATLNWSLLKAGLVDEIYVYIGPMVIGGERAPTLVDGPGFAGGYPSLELISAQRVDGGLLLAWRVLSP